MKNKLLIIIMLSVLLPFFPCHAQNIIWEHPGCNSETSMIRHYKDRVDIRLERFSYYYNSQRAFHYVDRATNLVFSFYFSPSVHDYEIKGDYLYFCGAHNGHAFWGYFNIDSVFFMGGKVYYREVPTYLNSDGDQIYSFNKLEVVDIAGSTHMIMTGGGYSNIVAASVLADAIVSSLPWNLHYIIDTSQTLSFDDVTITDNYAVVVGHTTPSSGLSEHYVLSHSLNVAVSPGPSIFSLLPNTISYYCTNSSIFVPFAQYINIVGMENDGFATVCTDISDPGNYRYVVSLYSSPTIDPYLRIGFSDGINGTNELAYSSVTHTLAMVTGVNHINTLTPPYSHIDIINTNMATGLHWFSIDSIPNSTSFTLSGAAWDYSLAKQWVYDMSRPNGCINKGIIEYSAIDRYQYSNAIVLDKKLWSDQPHEYTVEIIKSNMVIICR